MLENQINLKPLSRSFSIRKDAAAIDANEIEFIFSTGSEVIRTPWFSEPYIEELSLLPEHIRLERLNNGAPLLNSHMSNSLENVLGAIVKGSAKTDGKEGVARARLSSREEVKPIVQDVRDGIISHTSVGYRVYTYRDVTKPGDTMQRLLAIDWEPFEVSLVPVGADDLATTRSKSFEQNACQIISEEKRMGEENKTETKTVVADDKTKIVEAEKSGFEAGARSEQSRVMEITESCDKAGLDNEFKMDLIKGGKKIDEVRKLIIDKIAEKRNAGKDVQGQHVTLGEDISKRTFVDGVTQALMHRARPQQNKLEELGRKFRHMSLMDVLRFENEKIRGKNSWEISREDLIRAAYSTTSDFPNILSNVANKSLMQGYTYMEQTFEPFVTRKAIKDFKQGKAVQMGEFPELVQKDESGEFKSGSISDGGEDYQLVSYGRDFRATRELIINDDLDTFVAVPYKGGIACNMLECNLVYAQITSNPTMADGIALFHASHGNLFASGSAIDVGNLGTAKSYMRVQKGLDGTTPLNLRPIILLVPSTLETKGEQYVSVLQPNPLVADSAANVSPHRGRLQLIVEPRLDDNSTTAWYCVGDKNQIDTIMLGYLEGQESGPQIVTIIEEGVGITYRVYADRTAKVLNYRGFVKNPGA